LQAVDLLQQPMGVSLLQPPGRGDAGMQEQGGIGWRQVQ
jgi:hypothetical protein